MSRLLALLAGVVVLVTGGALLGVPGTPAPASPTRAPSTTTLTRQQLVCPATGTGGSGTLSSTAASGSVGVGLGASSGTAEVRRYATAAASGSSAYVVDGRRTLAPGLVAGVGSAREGSALACLPPAPDVWFTGVGAGSLHASRLQLVDPDASPAVAEIELVGPSGPVDAGPIRSVTVPGGSATTVDLPARVPTRVELAVHVTVVRGRLGAALSDRISDLATTTDWLPGQTTPARHSVLLGLAAGPASRTLVLANPGTDQAAVQLRVTDTDGTYTPTGVDPVEVPAGSLVSLPLPAAVTSAVAGGRAGLVVDADQPVTATLRSRAATGQGGDLSHAVASPLVDQAALLVPAWPDGRATLALAAPDQAGDAVVTAYDARGRRLTRRRLGVPRLTLADVALPAGTSLVTVRTTQPLAGAVRLTSGTRVAILPLTPLVTTGLVPAVTPAPPG